MMRLYTKVALSLSLATGMAVALASGAAMAQAAGDTGGTPTQQAISAMVKALSVANPSVNSNPDFTDNPDLLGTSGAAGGAVGPEGSGTENYPPGANGPEAPGSQSTGSTMGGFGG